MRAHRVERPRHRARSRTARAVAASIVTLLAVGCDGTLGGGPAGPSGTSPHTPRTPSPLPDETACRGPASVGVAPLRRITSSQYANAVRDLLDPLEVGDPSADLVPESALGGFRSNAAVPVSELEIRGYAGEAMRVAELVRADAAMLSGCPSPAAAEEEPCARAFAQRFASRAYRRPTEPAEVDRLLALFRAVRAEEPFEGALSSIVEAVLQSPHFLYRVELHEGATPGDVVALDGHQVATRLAFFLWDTIPDDALTAAAAAGELSTPVQVDAQARRMMGAAEGARAIRSFHLQWLGIDDVDRVEKDAAAFPSFDPELASLMREETARFADDVIRRGDGRFETLFTGGFSFLRGDLYALYGLPPREGDWARVEMDPSLRPGVLTQASFLAMHAHTDQTSPVHRGRMVREALFCESLPAPPSDVDDTPPDPDPGLTTRERFAAHSEVERCRACHERMDPIGLALEAYDGIGAHRALEAGRPVDTRGEIVGTDVEGELDGALELSSRVAASVQARQCLVRNWYRFALDRLETEEDDCSLAAAYAAFESSDFNVRELVFAIARSDSFRLARAPEVGP